MAKYHIPDPYLEGFKYISELSSNQASAIAEYLGNSQFGLNIDKIVEGLLEDEIFSNFNFSKLNLLVKAIFSILRIEDLAADEKHKNIDDLTRSVIDQSDANSEIDSETLKGHLETFLNISGKVKQTIKGRQLLRDNERNYVRSKLMTDIRVVFDEEVDSTAVSNAVIVHRLKIEYAKNSDIKDCFYALDSNDLLELKKNIERAIDKEKVLRGEKGVQSLNFLSLETKKDN